MSCFEIGGEFIFAISKFAFEEVKCGHTEMPSKDFKNFLKSFQRNLKINLAKRESSLLLKETV